MAIHEVGLEGSSPWPASSRDADILEELRRGNGHAKGLEATRRPAAAILTCVDERVVPEAIFGCVPGSLFCVRLAGHVVIPEVVASLEIALELGCRLVLVLGHTDCSAVRLERERTCDHFAIVQHIRRSTRWLSSNASLDEAIEANVRQAVKELRDRLRGRIEGGILSLSTGRVTVLG